MTVRERVRRTQHMLEILFSIAALAWGAAVGLVLLIVGAHVGIAAVGAHITIMALAWRSRFAFSFDRVALWIEERAPRLRYALVTAIDPRYAAQLDATVQPLLPNTAPFIKATAARTTLPALAALLAAGVAYVTLPSPTDRAATPATPRASAPVVLGNRLIPLRARITPPEYAGLAATTLDEPSTVSALRGSRVVLTGREGWTQSFTIRDTSPSLLKLEDRQYTRHVIIDPRIDQIPTVNLRVPARDTTLRLVTGNLQLVADITDDIGLGRVRFEYIISSGEQESFTFREGNLAERRGSGTKTRLETTVPFAEFKLKEGDRLSVRAVSWDNNTLYGPGKGTSETRTIRVARKGEYDTVSINRAPPSADTAMLSLRMLILATEKLQARRDTTPRQRFIDEAHKLGGQSEQIRRKIQQIIDETTGGGQIAPDTLLTIASDAMWEATRELYIAAPQTALPPMYVAYKALQALRNTKRYYIRGIQQPIIVNVERVRLSGGTDTGTATPRGPRAAERSILDQLRAAYAHAVRLLDDSAKADSAMTVLMTMRVASLRLSPPIATALGDAIAAMQSGRDVTPALLRTRRLLETTTLKLDSLPLWSGAWRQ